jgi:pimeloyl-ACP methyl ester carboxylesterase
MELLPLLLISPSAFAPQAELPPLLTFANGTRVTTPEAWLARRAELKAALQEHISGTLPPEPPQLLNATVLNTTGLSEAPLHTAVVRADYMANATRVSIDLTLFWRADLTKAKNVVPAFLTQYNHRGWALAGAQRGYLAVLYPGGDTRDASGDFRTAYPRASMRKILARAFVASRAIDLLTSDLFARQVAPACACPLVNASRLSISGHSRNGKQSLLAAAFDERFSSVVGSSPGTPIAAPVRYSSPDFNGETTTYVDPRRDWWLPSLRGYFGREHELPADGHFVLALIAPRHALLATADSDSEGDNLYAGERNIRAASAAYELLGAERGVRMRVRPARHHGALNVHSYFDWFDAAAGDASAAAAFEPSRPLHRFVWEEWRDNPARRASPPPPPPSSPVQERVRWLLGDGLASGSVGALAGASHYCETGDVGSQWDFASALMMRDSLRLCRGTACRYNVTRRSLSFGAYVTADLFVPTAPPAEPLPVAIFLHGYSYSMGYTGIYGLLDSDDEGGLLHAIAGRGVAVLAFDLVGMGSRQHLNGIAEFYHRHPDGSRLGAMVGEVHAAIDAVRCASSAPPDFCVDGEAHDGTYPKLRLPLLDPKRIALVGYSLGALVALHAAALLPSGYPALAGVAAFGGWTPMRSGAGGLSTGGLRALYETHALMPRLGFFEDEPSKVPYDMEELIGSLAPLPLLLYTPRRDRFAVAAEVASVARHARSVWIAAGANASLGVEVPDAPSDFRSPEVAAALGWIDRWLSKA